MFDGDRRLGTSKVLGDQCNQFLIRSTLDGRGSDSRDPSAGELLYERALSSVEFDPDVERYEAHGRRSKTALRMDSCIWKRRTTPHDTPIQALLSAEGASG